MLLRSAHGGGLGYSLGSSILRSVCGFLSGVSGKAYEAPCHLKFLVLRAEPFQFQSKITPRC